HAQVHHVEMRQLAVFEREELPDVLDVPFGPMRRQQFAVNAMHLPLWNVRRPDEVVLGVAIVALIVSGRHAPLVHPKNMHAIPAKTRSYEFLKHELGCGSARDRERRVILAGKDLFENPGDVMHTGLCGCPWIRISVPAYAHLPMTIPQVGRRREARARTPDRARRSRVLHAPASTRMSRAARPGAPR